MCTLSSTSSLPKQTQGCAPYHRLAVPQFSPCTAEKHRAHVIADALILHYVHEHRHTFSQGALGSHALNQTVHLLVVHIGSLQITDNVISQCWAHRKDGLPFCGQAPKVPPCSARGASCGCGPIYSRLHASYRVSSTCNIEKLSQQCSAWLRERKHLTGSLGCQLPIRRRRRMTLLIL